MLEKIHNLQGRTSASTDCSNSRFLLVYIIVLLSDTKSVNRGAFPMGYYSSLLLLLCFLWSSLFLGTHQLQSSQTQVLLQLRKHLEYPSQLEIWKDHTMDFCYLSSSPQVNMSCQDNFVTELRIIGDKAAKVNNFIGFAIANQTLSESFSMDSFVATLARLTSLRVLSLVSLGIWGPLPDKIHRLSWLEYLDLSSNYIFGSVPAKISTMVTLQTLVLDNNYLNNTVPEWFGSLSNLSVLSLKNNQLKGSFPSSIMQISTLTDLVLSGNEIAGKLPTLDLLTNLHILDLSANKFDSSLPSLPKGLVMAYLSNSSFTGEIPRQYNELSQLQHLDISFNALTGGPPAALFSLPNISYLNLASNMLSGSLPNHLSCSNNLQFVDLSNNRLTGGLPYCLSTESGDRVAKFRGNCLSADLHQQHEKSFCLHIPVEKKQSGGKDVGMLVAVISGILVVMVLAFGFLIVCRRYCPQGVSEQHLLTKSVQDHLITGFSSEILNNTRFISEAAKLGVRPFTLEELKKATNNFDNSTVMGEGSCGKLYKGRLENGMQVAIRCLPSSKQYSIRNLKLRLDLLAKLQHPHLVCLLGHCIDGELNDYRVNKVFLLYEYIPNGNLGNHLYEGSTGKILNWPERLSVLISIAKAVHFLHTGIIPGFFYNRLKTHNVLLNEHGVAKLSDYGLSIISDAMANSRENGGDLKSLQMTRLEDDVYGFGFILLESLVSSSASGRRDRLVLDELASYNGLDRSGKVINPIVQASSCQESLSTVISITNKCINSESWSRPSFEDILWNLQYAAQVQASADGQRRT